jgi:hypothetical protein
MAGCGTGTSATGAYTGPRPANAPYAKVLVVGVAPSSRARRSFEQQAVEAIGSGATAAVASIYVASEMNLGELSPENVRAMAKHTDADAVLVTRLINREAWLGQTQGKAYVKIGPQVTVIEQPGLTEVYEGYYSVQPVEGLPVAESAANLESVLYDVRDQGRAVYKVALNTQFEETDAEVFVDVVGELATGIAGELRGDGLIR